MNAFLSVLLRTIVWITCVVGVITVGHAGSVYAQENRAYMFACALAGLFIIFLAQGLTSLIPTRREIRERRMQAG